MSDAQEAAEADARARLQRAYRRYLELTQQGRADGDDTGEAQ